MAEVFTKSETASLNAYQIARVGHPYTCPNEHSLVSRDALEGHVDMYATSEGLVCWWPGCDYTQTWAHDFTKNWMWREMTRL